MFDISKTVYGPLFKQKLKINFTGSRQEGKQLFLIYKKSMQIM